MKFLMVLGVLLDSKLTISDHVSQVLSACASSTFPLKHSPGPTTLKKTNFTWKREQPPSLPSYASPTWWGFVGEGDRQRLGRLLARMCRGGYLPCDFPTLESFVYEADRKLFKSIFQNHTLVLGHLFTVKLTPTCSLRDRAHTFILPLKTIETLCQGLLFIMPYAPIGLSLEVERTEV